MGLRDTLRTWLTPLPAVQEERQMWPFFTMGDVTYPLNFQQTLVGPKEEIGADFPGLVYGGLQSNAIIYALEKARVDLFKQARPMYRRLRSGTPGELWSDRELDILRRPWPNGTTADLLTVMALDGDFAGMAFIARRSDHLARLRPDWVTIVHGSPRDTDSLWDADARVIGYAYQPGGPASGRDPAFFLVNEVACFVPLRDPLAPTRGISWLTPVIREVEADTATTTHKLAYFRHGATPNLVVTGVVPAPNQSLQDYVDKFNAKNAGAANAYKTLFFSPGVDTKVVGSNLDEISFKEVQGAGETRLAAAAGVPPVVAGLSEGLQGSSLNAGNFAASMRRFADLTGRPWWADAFASLATIIPVQSSSELWYDDSDIPALKDDVKDAAEVQSLQAQAIRQYVDAGFEPGSVVDAVNAGDLKRLRHTGLYSVQLQPPMPEGPEPEPEPEPESPAEAEPPVPEEGD